MQLPNLFSWKNTRNKYFIYFTLLILTFIGIVYTGLSYTYLSYFIYGGILQRPFESKSEYLIRSLIFLSHENMHNPEAYREYRDDLASFGWNDVKGDLIRAYLDTPFSIRSNYPPLQMVLLWPKEVKAECENIMMNERQYKTYDKKEYLKILYLHYYICNEQSLEKEASETCKKMRNYLKEQQFSDNDMRFGTFIIDTDTHFIKNLVNITCPE